MIIRFANRLNSLGFSDRQIVLAIKTFFNVPVFIVGDVIYLVTYD